MEAFQHGVGVGGALGQGVQGELVALRLVQVGSGHDGGGDVGQVFVQVEPVGHGVAAPAVVGLADAQLGNLVAHDEALGREVRHIGSERRLLGVVIMLVGAIVAAKRDVLQAGLQGGGTPGMDDVAVGILHV